MRWKSPALALLVLVALVVLGVWIWDLEMDLVRLLQEARATPGLLLAGAAVYAMLLAVPYMPGMELGLLLMMVFGPKGVVAAYVATSVGLNTTFALGWLARHYFSRQPRWQRWRDRAAAWDDTTESAGKGLLARVVAACNRRGGSADYLVIGVLLNLPGNLVLGGGGGIALLSALSGRVRWYGFALTVALATSILPLLAYFGVVDMERWLMALD